MALGSFLLFVIIAIFVARANKQRTERLALFAQQRGLQLFEGKFDLPSMGLLSGLIGSTVPDFPYFNLFDTFEPFGQGHSQEIQNLIVGRWSDLDWQIFDYEYTTGTGDDKHTHNFWIVAAQLPLTLPNLTMEPESLGTKLGKMFTGRDLNFELDEFNRRYYVRADNERAAYDIISPQMIEYLMLVPLMTWQMAGPYILIHDSGSLEPDVAGPAMQAIAGFFQRIPNYVREDAQSRSR